MEKALRKTYEFLVSVCKLDFVTENAVKWAFGVLQTNSVGLANGRGLYPIISIMSHACVPSLTPMVKPGEAMAFKTNRVISKGEELSIRYVQCVKSRKSLINAYIMHLRKRSKPLNFK